MEYQSVNKNLKGWYMLKRSFLTIILIAIYIVFASAYISDIGTEDEISTLAFVLWTAVFSVIFISWVTYNFVFPFLQYRVYGYKVENQELYIKSGVIFKSEVVVPFCQIQDITITEGPFESMFKICTLQVSTAGMFFKQINGLKREDANKLEQIVKENIKVFVKEKTEGEKDEQIQ